MTPARSQQRSERKRPSLPSATPRREQRRSAPQRREVLQRPAALQRRSAQRGIVYLEMLMSLLPILLTFLGICQLALFLVAQLVVQHAATRAARAAMVLLEDSPARFDGARRGSLTEGQSGEEDSSLPVDASAADLGRFSLSPASLPSRIGFGHDRAPEPEVEVPQGARMQAIRAAAYHPLAVLGPPPSSLLRAPTLQGELGSEGVVDSAWTRLLAGRLLYVRGAAAISLHPLGDPQTLLSEVAPREAFTVRVAFLFPCGVPLVASWMCSGRSRRWMSLLGIGSDEAERFREATAQAESRAARDLVLASTPYLALFEAEATMPSHGAHYYGRTE